MKRTCGMNVQKIQNLEEVFPLEDGATITDQKISRLTAPGDNYGSLMLSLVVTIKTGDTSKVVKTVAKLIPPSSLMQQVFNTPITFPNEIFFYKTVIPTLQAFQRKHGVKEVIDFAPKFFGGRLSLDPGKTVVDSGAVLLLENLKEKNFVNLERTEGFDLNVSKKFLKELAYLHGVSLALKIKEPETFSKNVRPYLYKNKFNEEMLETATQNLIRNADAIEACKPFMERIKKVYEINPYKPCGELFSAIVHNDCWVNNIMVQENNQNIKLLDFQVCDYGSTTRDLIFFLFSSVQNEVFRSNYDYLVQFYYDIFISILKQFQCNTSDYNFKVFTEELGYAARNTEFFHITCMLVPIFAPRGSVKEIDEMSPDDLSKLAPSDLYKEKFSFVVEEFAKRNWI